MYGSSCSQQSNRDPWKDLWMDFLKLKSHRPSTTISASLCVRSWGSELLNGPKQGAISSPGKREKMRMLSAVETLLLLSCTHRVTVWMRGKTGQCRISCHGYRSKTAINNHTKRATVSRKTLGTRIKIKLAKASSIREDTGEYTIFFTDASTAFFFFFFWPCVIFYKQAICSPYSNKTMAQIKFQPKHFIWHNNVWNGD